MSVNQFKIAEVAEVNPSVPKELANQPDCEVNFVPMSHVSEDGHIQSNGTRRLGAVIKGYTYFRNGDVLVAKITPCMENGKAAFVSGLPCENSFGSTEFHVLRPGPNVDGRYLFYMVWNPAFRHVAERNMTGTAGQKRVPKSFIERFQIPLPPLPEQKRIADILDKADTVRRKRREAFRATEDVLPSIFADLFGQAGSNYESQSLGDYLDFITSGSRGWAKYYVPSGKRFLRSLDVQMNRIGDDDVAFVDPPKGTEADRTRVQDGDVLITITGSRIGRVAFVPESFGEAYVSQHVAIARLKGNLRPRYCSMFLTLPNGGQRQIAKAQYGQTKPGLSLSNIRDFQIPVPPLSEQDRFLDAWAQFDKTTEKLTHSASECDDLFNSLVQRAFKGKL